ncbi:putative wall-associated receptor kinase-like 16 [Dioscorea cayenensis subsp. rotundata]|uniref:Wall-associated receptor kinase-like 16 n=1 Tax=Dioscorea cayennensis subsp. rotundata TaxID=55577 RepID=A0AB40BU09_DIOCR|nr:putative wall-associated receptor kinase-like 16 [Dioscorea cayenensis subsp. rotundata]
MLLLLLIILPCMQHEPADAAVFSNNTQVGNGLSPNFTSMKVIKHKDMEQCLVHSMNPVLVFSSSFDYLREFCWMDDDYRNTSRRWYIFQTFNDGVLHIERTFDLLLALNTTVAIQLALLVLARCLRGKWWACNLEQDKREHYSNNQSILLRKLISSSEGLSEYGFTIYTVRDLEKATNNFNPTSIIGNGGHATVFKGFLSDKRAVAIKMSKLTNPQDMKDFINELFILSKIRHKNVVKLFGCCLETEVPLLVFDFIPNGTLANHLHVRQSSSSLSWENRLRIVTEISGALAYLHCNASIFIFHRDVKSSNILLDNNFTAKMSDFGASRSILVDESASVGSGLVTLVQGTLGYLDPEYYHTRKLNHKNDVYSFGVILVEILTGKNPVSFTLTEQQTNLRSWFISAMKKKRLIKIVESHIVNIESRRQIEAVAKIAETCLRLRGDERPTMKEVEMALLMLSLWMP